MSRFRCTAVTGFSIGGTMKQASTYQVLDSAYCFQIVAEWPTEGGIADSWRHDMAEACTAALNEWDRTGDPELLKEAHRLRDMQKPGCVGCGCHIDTYTKDCKQCNARKRGRGLWTLLPRALGRDKRGRFTR